MDSLFDISWRIALGLVAIGLLVVFIQNRSKPGPEDIGKDWIQPLDENDSTALENRPLAAPTFDDFN